MKRKRPPKPDREPYEVIGVTYDGVKILKPIMQSTRFTSEEIREVITRVMREKGSV